MSDDEIIDAEIIEPEANHEVVEAQIIDGREREIDGLSIIAFVTSLIVFLYPFNAIIAIVLGLSARVTVRRSGRAGRGFARAALILGIAELVVGALIIVSALLAVNARANGESHYVPAPESTACVSLPSNCKVVEDGADGARAYVDTMKKLVLGIAGKNASN